MSKASSIKIHFFLLGTMIKTLYAMDNELTKQNEIIKKYFFNSSCVTDKDLLHYYKTKNQILTEIARKKKKNTVNNVKASEKRAINKNKIKSKIN